MNDRPAPITQPSQNAARKTPPRSLRLVIIVSFANMAGAQVAAVRLARGLRDRGHDPTVLFLYEREPLLSPDHPFDLVSGAQAPGLQDYARIVRDLYKRLRTDKPDVVLTFLPLGSALGQLLALAAGVRSRIISHRMPINTASPVLRKVDTVWAWLGIYTKVIAVSEAVARKCAHYPAKLRDDIEVINNGIRDWSPSRLSRQEARAKFAVPDGKKALVTVGRFVPQKNYPLMIEMMADLPDAILIIAGDGVLRGEITAQIERLGVGERVRLLGNIDRSEVPDLLAAGDLFVQTSLYEGQSNAVLEALLAGLPVVLHDVPEQRDTASDEDGRVAGALVPLNDRTAWVGAINTLLADEVARDAAREVALRLGASYRYETMVDKFERALLAA